MVQNQKLKTASNSPPAYNGGITIKSLQEIEAMRRAGAVVAGTLAKLKAAVQPGVTTKDLDDLANQEIRKQNGTPTFKGYRGFPGTICASINHEIVHGIPSKRALKEGDILKMDVGATVDGFIGDAAVTVAVGNVSDEALRLIEITRQCLQIGIKAALEGARTGDIGAAVEAHAGAQCFSVVREYVGHGVGRFLHEDPQVPNYGPPGRGALLRKGMAIAIEPMVNIGDWKTKLLDDQWTIVTADGSLSAHFEHTVLITDGEPEILTGVI